MKFNKHIYFNSKICLILVIILMFSQCNQISVYSGIKANLMNESSHKLNYQLEKSMIQLKLTSEKENESLISNNNKDSTNIVKFINDSTVFSLPLNGDNTASSLKPISGDFTAIFKINSIPNNNKGYTGIGLSSFKYENSVQKLSQSQWAGMIKYEDSSKKQWLITDNYNIAENGKWVSNPGSHFKTGDSVTIFRKANNVGFRVNDMPNEYKYYFDGDLYFIICLKLPKTSIESVSLVENATEFGFNSNIKLNNSVDARLAASQKRVGIKDLSDTAYKIIMDSLFNKEDSTSAKSGSNTLSPNSTIRNNQILQSPNDVYSVEIRNAELVVVENSGKSDEGILWKNGTIGESKSDKQILGLLADGTLYLQSDGNNEYYWTNKDRKKGSFTPPYMAKIKDNGEFSIEDSNYSTIWSTNSQVVDKNNSVGNYLSKNVPLNDKQCIISSNRKSKLCNHNKMLEITNIKNKNIWQNYKSLGVSSLSIKLNLKCHLTVIGDEKELWNSGMINGTSDDNCRLILTDEGYIEIVNSSTNKVLWSTNSVKALNK